MKKIILLGLNELNFDYIKYYIKEGELPNFKNIFDTYGISETTSEKEYKLLEPWIQWVTITTGKTYKEHEVFRLGDIVNRKDLTQLFEIAEEKGLKVGAVSPFNVDNRLSNPDFFVPDPWTKTKASGSWLIKNISKAVSESVNDNAKEKVSKSSIIYILLGLICYVKPTSYFDYIKVISGIKKNKGTKAVILDKLLSDVFLSLWKKNEPDFSNLFLNTGAHFQHHYMFNSAAYGGNLKNPDWYCSQNQDPLLMILKEYDKTIGSLMKLDIRLIIATGLHQKPHNHNTFYWRLKNHDEFVKENLNFHDYKRIIPRMSRDFLMEFENKNLAKKCQEKLESLIAKEDGQKIFTIDNRGDSLFVELTYDNDISDSFTVTNNKDITIKQFKLKIAFVAIKNGEHHHIGYFLDTDNSIKKESTIELSSVYDIINEGFDVFANDKKLN